MQSLYKLKIQLHKTSHFFIAHTVAHCYNYDMRTREAFLTLIEELEGDFTEIKRLETNNQRAWKRIENGAVDVLDYRALAFTIHTGKK
jgi:hypothetical protein